MGVRKGGDSSLTLRMTEQDMKKPGDSSSAAE